MSYQIRYFAQFIDTPMRNEQSPYTKQYIRVQFMLDGYDGPAEELEIYASDGLRRKKTSSDNLFEAINPKAYSIKLRTHSVTVARGLFTEYDRQWRVEIYRKSSVVDEPYRLEFAGWLVPTYTQFDYKKPPFALNLTAACGLASLKDRLLLDANGKRLTVKESPSTVIRTALALTGHDLDLISAINLYELSDMAAGQTVPGPDGIQTANPNRDPLRRTLLNTLSLLTDKNEPVTAYDALKNILEAFPGGLRISQEQGKWMLVRGTEAPGGWDPQNVANDTVRARLYPAGTAPDSSPASNQSINLNTTIYPGNAVRAKTGGATGMTPQKAGVQIDQKFGARITKFPNGNLSQADNTGLPADWDRYQLTAQQALRVGSGTEVDPYKVRIYGYGQEHFADLQPSIGVHITLPVNVPAFNREIKWTLKGTYQLNKLRSAQIAVYCKQNGAFTYARSSEWVTKPGMGISDRDSIRFDNSRDGGKQNNPVATDFSITFNPINKVTDLYIRFLVGEDMDKTDGSSGGQQNPDAYTDFWNLSLTTELDGLNLTGQSVSTSRDGRKPEPVATLTYGDYPADADNALTLTGILTTRASDSPTATWYHPADSALLNGKPLIGHHLQIRANQAMQAVDSWQGKLSGPLPYGMHSVLRFADIGDVDPVHNILVPWPFVITALETDERLLEHTVTAVRYMPDINLPGKKSYWQTPDGDILQSADETGTASAPVEPIKPTFPNLPPDFLDRIQAGLHLPAIEPLPDHAIIDRPDYSISLDVLDNGRRQATIYSFQRLFELPANVQL